MKFKKLQLKKMGWTLFFVTSTLQMQAQSFELIQSFSDSCDLMRTTGVSVADYDLDGDLDVFIVAADVFDQSNSLSWSRLLRNENGQEFTDVTMESNLTNWNADTRNGTMGSKMGASWGDYDNDGYPDLFIANYGYDELWHNEGDGTFTNVTDEANIAGCFFCYSTTGVWWDYDNDGDLDIYVTDWLKPNRLFRNDGDNTFTDISEASGLNDGGHTFSSLPMDVNDDGLCDLYVVNDISGNEFYKNIGNNQFELQTGQAGLEWSGNGMGVDVCDFNRDGFFDIYVTSIFTYVPNPFFVNDGTGVFTDHALQLGIDDTGWGWSTRFFDADHDMDEDLYVVNGFDSPTAEGDKNFFFEFENGSFQNISSTLGLNTEPIALGQEVFDYDSDGDLDILVGNRDAPSILFQNQTIETQGDKNWLQIQLEGTTSNRNAFGSKVKILCEGENYNRYHSGINVFGQSIKPVHFGLAEHQEVDDIQVHWQSGLIESFGSATANQIVHLVEGTGTAVLIKETSIVSSSTVFPNPFSHDLFLKTENESSKEGRFTLLDLMGKEVYNNAISIPSGENTLTILSHELKIPSGIFFYTLKGETINLSGKIIKE